MGITLSKKDAYGVMFKEYPDVVTAEQMSEMLGISNKTAYRLLQKNISRWAAFIKSPKSTSSPTSMLLKAADR